MGGAAPAGGFEFGVNPDDDPELALALRVSMEEQRARQQAEGGAGETGAVTPGTGAAGGEDESSEEAMLQRALAMSMDGGEAPATRAAPQARDLGSMTEEEQIAYAMQVRIIGSSCACLLMIYFVLFRCPWLKRRKQMNLPSLSLWMWTRKIKITLK